MQEFLGPEKGAGSSGAETGVIGSCEWALGTEPWSSARALHTLNHKVTPPAPREPEDFGIAGRNS